jgi:hypothetical protein
MQLFISYLIAFEAIYVSSVLLSPRRKLVTFQQDTSDRELGSGMAQKLTKERQKTIKKVDFSITFKMTNNK